MALRSTPEGPILTAKVAEQTSGAIQAFLDTGSSGIVLSATTAQALGVSPATGKGAARGQKVTFEDVGVGGSEQFSVSEPLYAAFAPYTSTSDGSNAADYAKPIGPLRVEIRPPGGLLEALTGGLDIAGMPAIVGRVVVIDPRPVNTFADTLRTQLLAPNDPAIPKVDRHIPLTEVSFARFTRLHPAGAAGPAQAPNPMIGPNPFAAGPATQPARSVILTHGGKTAAVTLLLDTGAAASMLSIHTAAKLGIHYDKDGKTLLGVPREAQFTMTIGGIGGNKTASGFYVDRLALPTTEGKLLVYTKAPFLVSDITVLDPKTNQSFTLDGVFGMNFLVASAKVTGGLLPDIGHLTEGAFQMLVLDEPHGVLGVKMR